MFYFVVFFFCLDKGSSTPFASQYPSSADVHVFAVLIYARANVHFLVAGHWEEKNKKTKPSALSERVPAINIFTPSSVKSCRNVWSTCRVICNGKQRDSMKGTGGQSFPLTPSPLQDQYSSFSLFLKAAALPTEEATGFLHPVKTAMTWSATLFLFSQPSMQILISICNYLD